MFIPTAERALELMIARASQRTTFGRRLVDQGVIQEWIADSRLGIDQARLYTRYAAHRMDTVGNRGRRRDFRHQGRGTGAGGPVIDGAIQGVGGLSQNFPLARMWADARTMRLADGPDEVHRAVAPTELRRFARPPVLVGP